MIIFIARTGVIAVAVAGGIAIAGAGIAGIALAITRAKSHCQEKEELHGH